MIMSTAIHSYGNMFTLISYTWKTYLRFITYPIDFDGIFMNKMCWI